MRLLIKLNECQGDDSLDTFYTFCKEVGDQNDPQPLYCRVMVSGEPSH